MTMTGLAFREWRQCAARNFDLTVQNAVFVRFRARMLHALIGHAPSQGQGRGQWALARSELELEFDLQRSVRGAVVTLDLSHDSRELLLFRPMAREITARAAHGLVVVSDGLGGHLQPAEQIAG